MRQVYKNTDVLTETRLRVGYIFDEFKNIIVSVSGGKDSTVLAHLILEEAHKRGRKIGVFFLDEEVVYSSTVEQIRHLMTLYPENTIPMWYQIPFNLTNASSSTQTQLHCWEEGMDWMRPKDPMAIQKAPWNEQKASNRAKGYGFYDALASVEKHNAGACFCVGIRAAESLNRWRAVTRNGYKRKTWFTAREHTQTAYPLYDWQHSDIWRYIHDFGVKYSKIYDYMHKKGLPTQEIRVSSLIHEHSFKALVELPEFEPETYNRLLKRVEGIQVGHLYGKNELLRTKKRPSNFSTWRAYRDFLLETLQDPTHKPIFEKRFDRHLENEFVAKQQCRQLLLNDYENNLPVNNKPDPRKEVAKKWKSIL